MSARPKMTLVQLLSLCIFVNTFGTNCRAEALTHCVELGGGSQMCLDIKGDVDWLACEVDGCSYVWEPAALPHLTILDHAIAEETLLVAAFHNQEMDLQKAALAAKHKAALAELEAFRDSVKAAIKAVRDTR